MSPESANTDLLCRASVTRKGAALVTAATAAPRPSMTNRIGSAQQISVPAEVNSVSQLTALCRSGEGSVFIACSYQVSQGKTAK
ncbi:hypothetical protein KTD26_29820 [Burkholderia multivorans]|uniref:hypothetical protein n=1 Tax=Burkholderia TaxID=32008 RepID=UPI001C22E723|nr:MULTISPECIES: hypothetical protein [Burkholderia]MBU9146710.1 hypothetical protein [Burkholderia multivorans]MBU9439137.1 hypothetical protein [Burkholderia multivorans]MBU9540634.1 hypothetical protein [Burkholderia multivorans]HEF4773400.1 hypothetical protein [Burkholderia multivorans]